VCAGCRSGTQIGGQTQTSGNSSVVLAITDTPPSNVSILSAEVTLTGATLNPGNVSLFSGSTTIELTRLQTDIGYLATAANVPAGSYTSVNLTFANPLFTIENNTASPIVSGSTTCAVASICSIPPVTTANLSTTVALSAFTIASSSTTGLLIDVNLDNLLNATMGADFSAGTTVTPFTPAGSGAPQVGAEDVVGHVTSVSAATNSFTLQNVTGSYVLKVESTSSFFQFTSCLTPGIACVQTNQILSVDIGILSDGSLLARNIVFEDADSTDTEVEGMIVSTNLASQQFTMVTLAISATGSGLNIGNTATVQYSNSPQTPFDVDVVHADNLLVSTTGFSFTGPTQLSVGQEVSIRRNSSSSGGTIVADRVRLRSTRVTATVQSIGAPNIYLYNLPSFFFGHGGITQIQVQTSTPTIISENNILKTLSEVPLAGLVSVRGPLFSGATPALIATKVAIKP
jgi:hypothetical protein